MSILVDKKELTTNKVDKRIKKSFLAVDALAMSEGKTSIEELNSIECPITKVVLFRVMGTTLKKRKNGNPTGSLICKNRRKELFGENQDPRKLNNRSKKLVTALTSLHSSQTKSTSTFGCLGWHKLINGLLLYLDKTGVSDTTISRFSTMGICTSIKTLRDEVHHIARDIKQREIREELPTGVARVFLFIFDNANIHIFGKCVNLIAAGNIDILHESKARSQLMNEEYIKHLPSPSENELNFVLPNEEDDEIAKIF